MQIMVIYIGKKGDEYLKKITALILVLFLVACGSGYTIHDDFNADLEQVLDKLDTAYEEKRELDGSEENLVDKFRDKYRIGQFTDSEGKTYEMNDLEKEIAAQVSVMSWFTDSEESLASEENLYEYSRNLITDYLKTKELPEELIGKHPAYELYNGIHPEIKADAQEIIDEFDIVVNGSESNVDMDQRFMLNHFIERYETEFEIDGKVYLVNDESNNVIYMVENLLDDLKKGRLLNSTVEQFNKVKEEIK